MSRARKTNHLKKRRKSFAVDTPDAIDLIGDDPRWLMVGIGHNMLPSAAAPTEDARRRAAAMLIEWMRRPTGQQLMQFFPGSNLDQLTVEEVIEECESLIETELLPPLIRD